MRRAFTSGVKARSRRGRFGEPVRGLLFMSPVSSGNVVSGRWLPTMYGVAVPRCGGVSSGRACAARTPDDQWHLGPHVRLRQTFARRSPAMIRNNLAAASSGLPKKIGSFGKP
ncbi:hypothetical protein SAMN05446635_4853 [Burkholderia sp. OK233]|nr:hypothetical protein SAMN05446635_4853 [Burkholderia sp. OK233]